MKASATDNSPAPEISYSFGLYVLDPGDGTLTRDSVRVRVQEQPFQLLLLLVERAGQIVSREEIRNRLWPQNTFVEFDKSLGVAVLKVREALGDDAGNPRFIETIPRRGYRFIAPVKVETAHVADSTAPTPAAPTVSVSHLNLYATKHGLIIATLVLLLVGMVFYVLRARHGAPRSTAQAGDLNSSNTRASFGRSARLPQFAWPTRGQLALRRCLRNVEYRTGRRRRAPNGLRRGCGARQERTAAQRRRFAWQIYLAAFANQSGRGCGRRGFIHDASD